MAAIKDKFSVVVLVLHCDYSQAQVLGLLVLLR